jgi:serine phosphatase RsbU (regulator of sigma subunit)
MSYLIRRIFENKTARILFYFYFIIIILTSFFIIFNYFNQKKQIAETVHTKLWSIVKTASSQVSGDDLDNLLKNKPNKNDLVTHFEDSTYLKLQTALAKVDSIQELDNPLYILQFDKSRDLFRYVIRSDEKVYYLHEYKLFPKELKLHYDKGGFLPVYETENGTWLSAFEPIRNRFNRVVGVVEADVNAKEYFEKVKNEFLWMLFYSVIGVILIALILLPVVIKILRQDEEYIKEITYQKETIEAYSNEVQASSRYASNIQKALVRTIENKGVIKSITFLNQPRDIVSGDFRWSFETEEFVYFSVGDCTGHGMPGAVLSVIGATILNGLFVNGKDKTPEEVLLKLDKQFTDYINLSSDQLRMDGMDICVLRLNKMSNELMFSGALQNLVCFQDGELKTIKGCRFPIGAARFYPNKKFINHTLPLKGKLDFFIYTDGFQDQFGGEKGKKLGSKNFLSVLNESLTLTGKSRVGYIEKQVEEYQGQEFQVDDRLLMSLEMEIFH